MAHRSILHVTQLCDILVILIDIYINDCLLPLVVVCKSLIRNISYKNNTYILMCHCDQAGWSVSSNETNYVYRPLVRFNVITINQGNVWDNTNYDNMTIKAAGIYYVSMDFTSCYRKTINFYLNVNNKPEFKAMMQAPNSDSMTRGQAGILRLSSGTVLSVSADSSSSDICYIGNPLYISFIGFWLGHT